MTSSAPAPAASDDAALDDLDDLDDHQSAHLDTGRLVPGLPQERADDERLHWKDSAPFLILQLTPLLILVTGISWKSVALLAVTFWGRMFFITAGYHRYFSHRSYRLARFPQFLMALGGSSAAQKGVLWWASHHRDHHRYSDTDKDVHSPQRGFWWSHAGWIVCEKHAETKWDRIKDFAKYPELRWLNKYDWVAPWSLAGLCFLIDGWRGLVVGFLTSTVLLWHATFFINSLAHVFGRRRYATEDTSRNSALLAVLTMGEGWHNNHHYFQASARQGFFWWEWDPSFYILRALSWVGIVKDLKAPSAQVKAANRVRQGTFDIGMFRAHLNQATRAVTAASAHVSVAVHDRTAHASEALLERREAIEASLTERKAALEGFMYASLESAEELARTSRRGQRELGVVAD
jgi:stearoyl-CoA desaturase (delta-9 desaturase)